MEKARERNKKIFMHIYMHAYISKHANTRNMWALFGCMMGKTLKRHRQRQERDTDREIFVCIHIHTHMYIHANTLNLRVLFGRMMEKAAHKSLAHLFILKACFRERDKHI